MVAASAESSYLMMLGSNARSDAFIGALMHSVSLVVMQ
jgi:hypothetical protein